MVERRLAAADVVRDILSIRSSANAGRNIHAGDIDANSMPFTKEIGGGHDFNRVLVDLARNNCLLSFPR